MTYQIPDTIEVDGEVHDLVATTGPLWRPPDDLPTVFASTAYGRGFRCAFEVSQQVLRLRQLDALVGRYDSDDDFVAVVPPALAGKVAVTMRPSGAEPFNAHYEDLALKVPFTGRVVIGRQLEVAPLTHPEEPPWSYRVVHVLEVDDGQVVRQTDVSQTMADIRRWMNGGDLERAARALDTEGLGWLAWRVKA